MNVINALVQVLKSFEVSSFFCSENDTLIGRVLGEHVVHYTVRLIVPLFMFRVVPTNANEITILDISKLIVKYHV